MNGATSCRVPLLFLVADTGGGHRRAALAVAEALERSWQGLFAPVLFDPLTGPGVPWRVSRAASLYGPLTRWAPWSWGALYRASDSPRRAEFLWKTWLARASRDIGGAMAGSRAEIVVSFHPLLTGPVGRAVKAAGRDVPLVTVVTDLVSVHSAWRGGCPEVVAAPSAAVASCFAGSTRCCETGLPVGPGVFSAGKRAAL